MTPAQRAMMSGLARGHPADQFMHATPLSYRRVGREPLQHDRLSVSGTRRRDPVQQCPVSSLCQNEVPG
jgi:hypothetical protein